MKAIIAVLLALCILFAQPSKQHERNLFYDAWIDRTEKMQRYQDSVYSDTSKVDAMKLIEKESVYDDLFKRTFKLSAEQYDTFDNYDQIIKWLKKEQVKND